MSQVVCKRKLPGELLCSPESDNFDTLSVSHN